MSDRLDPEATSAIQIGDTGVHGCMQRRSHVGLALQDEQRPEEAVDNKLSDQVSEGVRCCCARLGMAPDAVDGWAKFHCNPVTAIVYNFGSYLLLIGTSISILLGAPFTRYYHSVPYLVGLIITLGQLAATWRLGPNITKYPLALRTYPVYALCCIGAKVVTFLGPPENVPYHNSILYTALVTLFLFTRMLVNSTGFLHTHCPGAPHKSYTALIANNIFRTARVVDCLTDISFVKVLIREQQHGCSWFGVQGRCEVYIILIAGLLLCAAIDFAVTVYMFMMSYKLKSNTRLVLALNTVSMICELGVVAVTLLQLLSTRDEHEPSGSESESQSEAMGTVIASLASTLAVFLLTLIGAGSAASGAKLVVSRASAAGASLLNRSRQSSGNGGVGKIVPVSPSNKDGTPEAGAEEE